MSVDILSDVLTAVRLKGAVFFDVEASVPWVAEALPAKATASAILPDAEHVMEYHVITGGSCWASVIGHDLPPIQLLAGDVVAFPQGDAHILSSAPGMRGDPGPDPSVVPGEIAQLPVMLNIDGGGSERAHLVCGFLGCDSRPYNPLLTALPRVIVINDHTSGALGAYFRAALAECKDGRMGGADLLGRISELMFVDAVRRHLETLPEDRVNWLAGLRDQYVGRALMALHSNPARDWSLEALAQAAALSRSAFAERFTQYVGHPPMQYLTNWRMQLATNYLRRGTETVASIANRVGYDSEAAFSRAFKKVVGAPPSEWREMRVPRAAQPVPGIVQ